MSPGKAAPWAVGQPAGTGAKALLSAGCAPAGAGGAVLGSASCLQDRWGSAHVCASPSPEQAPVASTPGPDHTAPPRWRDGLVRTLSQDSVQRLSGHCLH